MKPTNITAEAGPLDRVKRVQQLQVDIKQRLEDRQRQELMETTITSAQLPGRHSLSQRKKSTLNLAQQAYATRSKLHSKLL